MKSLLILLLPALYGHLALSTPLPQDSDSPTTNPSLTEALASELAQANAHGKHGPLNNLTSPYMLTAFAPWNPAINGAKINNLNLFQERVYGYCPFTGNESYACPNGTDMAFAGTLNPLSVVPGGQDLYVNVNGLLAVTVQHSHSIPPGAWWSYYGWTWTALPAALPATQPRCPADDPTFNCTSPTGFFWFQAPGSDRAGVRACPNPYFPDTLSVWAVTPEFNQTGCEVLAGLGTVPYGGVSPPVWAY